MLKKTALLVTCIFFMWGTISCGTLIYPERRGQESGRIDPKIAVLDGLGLLVFIIPGLIAYAVDFATGAIYLPGTGGENLLGAEVETMKTIRAASRDWTDITAAVEQQTGYRPDLADPGLRIYLPDRQDLDFGRELASLAAGQPVADGWKACSVSPDGTLTTADGRPIAMPAQN